jgi:RNA methyltransferase, TrmH family
MSEKITSFQNPRVKLIKRLRDKRDREREGRFVIDDLRDFERALDCGFELDYAFICPELAEDARELNRAERRIPVQKRFEVSREMMEKVSYRTHPGVISGVMHMPSVSNFEQATAYVTSPVLSLVGLQKPGNIGALLRTADAAGFKTIFLIDTALDLFNPNIIRSSTGAVFLPNIYQITGTQAATFFQQQHYQLVAAHLEGDENLFSVQFADRCAILLGTEDVGLDDIWVERCDVLLKIPMVGELSDSLNVSVSGAVIMYEVLRQRMRP